jgi:hypothetical protein
LERISTMRLPDDRGPLEHLYSLHIPNCDKHGLYNLKQVSVGANLAPTAPAPPQNQALVCLVPVPPTCNSLRSEC